MQGTTRAGGRSLCLIIIIPLRIGFIQTSSSRCERLMLGLGSSVHRLYGSHMSSAVDQGSVCSTKYSEDAEVWTSLRVLRPNCVATTLIPFQQRPRLANPLLPTMVCGSVEPSTLSQSWNNPHRPCDRSSTGAWIMVCVPDPAARISTNSQQYRCERFV